MERNYSASLRQLCLLLFTFSLFSFVILLAARGLFFLSIRDALPDDPDRVKDTIRAFTTGARFDAKVTAIAYAPLLLSGLVCAAWQGAYTRWIGWAKGYHTVVVFLYVVGSIANYYYYRTYGHYVDLFVFGLWDDDTSAILSSVWQDYPILRGVLAAVVLSGIAYFAASGWLASRWGQRHSQRRWHWSASTVLALLMIASTFVVARGSIGSLPLKRYHASVSAYPPLNMLTPNVFMALDWARSDYQHQAHFESVSASQLQKQMVKLLGQPTPNYHTPTNAYLSDNPPHVVLAMMESMGMNVLVEDNPPQMDLLGSLRPYWQQGFLFQRFMAGTSATIDSIVMMLCHSPVATISHSSMKNVALPSSAVLPYKRAGYRVVFVYGGNGMWRNLSEYLPVQGFDRVYDENDIIKAFPVAKSSASTWGVADDYLFQFANRLLEQASQPTMMFIMTTTNHSPYKVPKEYQPKPTAMSERLSTLIGYQGDQASTLLKTYQYAADSVGKFIQRIKASPTLKDKTVIAVTGDHRMRYSTAGDGTEYALTYSVPFYLNVPPSILKQTPYYYDPQRIGSHRDVFPTLYHFSLSDQDYISLGGENLLSEGAISNHGFNTTYSINAAGVISSDGSGLFHRWDDQRPLWNQATPDSLPTQEANWGKAYSQLQYDYLNSQLVPMTP